MKHFLQFAVRLESYFLRWIDMSKIDKSFKGLADLILRDQFIHVCNRDLTLFIKERTPKSMEEVATLADQFREARFTNAASLVTKSGPIQTTGHKGQGQPLSSRPKPEVVKPVDHSKFVPKSERRCYKCNQIGHIASECRPKHKVGCVVSESADSDNQVTCTCSEETFVKVCSAFISPLDSVVNSQASSSLPHVRLTSSCQSNVCSVMPISSGFVEGNPVSVLRDTGCSGIVVRRSKISDDNLTGKSQTCLLADGSTIDVPIAKIHIDTPYVSGTYEAWCMETPVYDCIVGNVANVREPGKPDPNWKPVIAVETRQQAKSKGKPFPKLSVPEIIKDEISPDDIRTAQTEDNSMSKIRAYAQNNETFYTKRGKVKWYMKNGLVYRQYSSTKDDKICSQLVVPSKYRTLVIRLAHESIMSGHLATRRTVSRVLSEFHWPGIQADVKRFCQSCDVCQKTVPKGKITKVPLQQMPFIDEPFKRVAVDLIGPLHPPTDKGNRYILTLVDYATRYPEAEALPNIETERVAEALVGIFSRVGVPREMLTDMGSQFTSLLMKELSRLISMKQLTTTPYHPMCNGLVEKFNGTLKQIIKRVCTDRPRDWDKYLSAALFAYREVPQESLGFSPFELVYGRSVRGPMTILKELWTKEIEDPEIKSTYQYVIDLRERLESTCKLAHENLEKASQKHRLYYNRKAKHRSMKVGERVLVLLPTDSNKLLMQWKGPFRIVDKPNKVDYKIDMNGKTRTFHANLLKLYVERKEPDQQAHGQISAVTVQPPQISGDFQGSLSLVSSVVIDCSVEDHGEISDLPELKPTEGPSHVDISSDLLPEQQHQVSEILDMFPDVLSDLPGYTNILQHDIKLSTNIPVRKSRPIPYNMLEVVNKEVEQMLKMNIIEPSTSPYSSPVVIVKKKDGSNRFCIDFRGLNSQTVFDAEPMPDADQIFSKLATNTIFSKLDLSKGYWQVPLTPSSKMLTAFQSPKGLFQFRVMPFGLVTAPATFSRLMRNLLQGMENIDNFIDDVLIYSQSFTEHVSVLHELLTRLRSANLTAKPSKCSVGYKQIECLGHIVGNASISPNPDKVEVIQTAIRPGTKKQLRSFLGLVGFYRKFVPNFSLVALPLTDLTKKGCPNKLQWTDVHETAFQTLKHSLITFPILKLPNLSEPFILQTDASDRGIGAVLLQTEVDKKFPIAYASRKLKGSEVSYATVEKECLAIVWAIQKFQRYLYGREFVLETDHKPLVYLNRAKVANSRLMRWALALQPYRFRIVAIKGKDNVGGDYLSRL